MNAAVVSRNTLKPRQPKGTGKGFGLALLVHAGLIVAIALGVSWRSRTPDAYEAELWAAVPQKAAPRAVEPEPAPVPAPAPPAPPPKPVPKVVETPPPPPAPDPQIAIEKAKLEKERERKLEEDRLRKLEDERLRKLEDERLRKLEEDRVRKTEEERTRKVEEERERQQALREKQEELRKKQEADKRKELEEQKKRLAEEERAAARLEAARKANLERMMGQAGATGDARATGSAQQSAGPSAGYAGRIKARVKPNIVYFDDVPGNPSAEVEVRAAPDGTITGRRLVKSSGVKEWDEAVLRAIDRTAVLPQDVDGRVPPALLISFRVRDSL